MKKNKKATTRVKYFTKPLLQEAGRNAEKWDFNRQLNLEAINGLPDARFPVTLTLLHHHRHGEPAETHIRAMVVLDGKGRFAFVDIPLEFFDKLPEATVRVRRGTAKQLRGQLAHLAYTGAGRVDGQVEDQHGLAHLLVPFGQEVAPH